MDGALVLEQKQAEGKINFGRIMRVVIIVALYLFFSGCTSKNENETSREKNKEGFESFSENIDLISVKEGKFQFKVPSGWKSVDYADTIPEYFAYKLYEESDSAFIQVSLDNTSSGIDTYLKGEFDLMNSWEVVQTEKYCIEEIQLKNKKSVWYAQLYFSVSEVEKVGHFFIIPYNGRLYQLRLSMPAQWDNEWARYLMSQLAFDMLVDGVVIFKRSDEILKVEKDCN